jgi:hypothetical protein
VRTSPPKKAQEHIATHGRYPVSRLFIGFHDRRGPKILLNSVKYQCVGWCCHLRGIASAFCCFDLQFISDSSKCIMLVGWLLDTSQPKIDPS